MLDALFGSASRARLLAVVLAEPRREYHLRELIRAVGGGASSVQRDVDRLEALGLLATRRTDGGRRMVAAAERHPLLEPLRAVLAAGGAAGADPSAGRGAASAVSAQVHPFLRPRLDAVVAALRAAGAEHAVLFGSATQTEDTAAPADLDVVVRLGGPGRGRAARYFALRRALEEAAGLPVDLLEEEAVDNPYLRDEIERTGVTLVAAA
jgi:predicted nucleotidyltransferase